MKISHMQSRNPHLKAPYSLGFVATLLGLLLLLASSHSFAVGLGTVQVDSIFGQPLSGNVQLINASGFDENSISVSVASREAHKQIGIPYSAYLTSISTELKFRANGSVDVEFSSPLPLREPFIEFALELAWPNGRIVREYTLLLTMPNSAIPLKPNLQDTPPQQTSNVRSKTPIPHSSVHTLEPGDSLSHLAERLQDREVSHAQAVATLEVHNSDLIERRGGKGLLVGDKIRIPSKEVFAQPAAPIRGNSTASSNTKSSSDKSDAEIGSAALRAEIRLRALGYASLQQQAAGETTNPVVASGAAATILERLIEEQGENSPESLTNVTRLTEGLNEVSNISRAYQARLAALEETAKANSDKLANLIEERDRLLAERGTLDGQSTILDSPDQSPRAGQHLDIEESRSIFSLIPYWIYISVVLILAAAACLFIFLRFKHAESVYLDQLQEDVSNQTRTAPVPDTPPDQSSETDFEAAVLLSDSENTTSDDDAETSSDKPFYEEETEERPGPADFATEPTLDDDTDSDELDLDSELDEELKLISSFERTLAAETASRTQAKQYAEDAPMANPIQLDSAATSADADDPETLPQDLMENSENDADEDQILEFHLETLDDERPEDLILEESQVEEDGLMLSDDEDTLVDDLSVLDGLETLEDPEVDGDADTDTDTDTDTDSAAQTDETLEIPEEFQSDEAFSGSSANEDHRDEADVPSPLDQLEVEPLSAPEKSEQVASYSGFADTTGFNHINPVEAIEVVSKKLQAAKDAGKETTLFYIDIDNFEALENDIGTIKAEKVAAAVASQVFDRIDNPITLKRFKQNAFILLLQGGQSQNNLDFGMQIAAAIAATPVEVSKETFFVTLSIGIVPVASGFSNSSQIIDLGRQVVSEIRADQDGNGAKLCDLDPELAHNEASIVREGRRLINEDKLITVYQPITALKGDPLEFYQARTIIPEEHRTLSLPADLITRIADTDLSTELDCMHITQALHELNQNLSSHVSTRVFVSISARSATDNFFRNWFEKTIFAEGVHPERIVFQMTEHSISRHLNGLVEFRDFAHGLGSRICISHLDFKSIPEDAVARLHPDYAQLHPDLSLAAQQDGNSEVDMEKQRQGLVKLTEVLEKARPVCDRVVVPGVKQARLIPTLWPLAVDYILGDYIKPESLNMDYEFDELAQ